MTENKIKYNSYENSFYINDDEGISQIIAPELIIEIINDYEKEIVKNKELKKENNELKQQFILLLKKLGKKNVQCSFCEHGEHYTELVDGYYEPRFICHKKGQEYTQRSFCEDWKIKVEE